MSNWKYKTLLSIIVSNLKNNEVRVKQEISLDQGRSRPSSQSHWRRGLARATHAGEWDTIKADNTGDLNHCGVGCADRRLKLTNLRRWTEISLGYRMCLYRDINIHRKHCICMYTDHFESACFCRKVRNVKKGDMEEVADPLMFRASRWKRRVKKTIHSWRSGVRW